MLKIFKQWKKQTEHVSALTKYLIVKIHNERDLPRDFNYVKSITTLIIPKNKVSLHTLRFFANKKFKDITNATFKACLQDAILYHSRDYVITGDENNLYFKAKEWKIA